MSAQQYRGKQHRPWLHQLWRMARDELVQLLLVALGVVAGTWIFVGLAGEVLEGDTQAFDRWFLQALRSPEDPSWPRGPRWLVEVGRDVTAFGSPAVVALLTGVVLGEQSQFSQWPCCIGSGGVPDPGDSSRPARAQAIAEGLLPRGHDGTYLPGGSQPGLSGRPLSHGCACRLGCGFGLGPPLLAGRVVSPAAWSRGAIPRIRGACGCSMTAHAAGQAGGGLQRCTTEGRPDFNPSEGERRREYRWPTIPAPRARRNGRREASRSNVGY
jgi:hypothetical protein